MIAPQFLPELRMLPESKLNHAAALVDKHLGFMDREGDKGLTSLTDLLEDMSFEDGKAYNARLMSISRGTLLPDRSVPVENITYNLWESMRAFDKKLADDILEPVFTFMQTQTDPQRKNMHTLHAYLEYRERDVGRAQAFHVPSCGPNNAHCLDRLFAALMRFVLDLNMTPAELHAGTEMESNCAKHLSVVNDTYSWEKELRKSQESDAEGSTLCSLVKVLADECNLGIEASKRILWSICREWELLHLALVDREKNKDSRIEVERYCERLGQQMSGNEMWSRSTARYKASSQQ